MPTQSQISLSPLSAKGDILSFDGSSRSRVSVGTNGQILSAQSTATSGISWIDQTVLTSGSFELISSTTLTASSTVSFINIPNGTSTRYVALHLFGYARTTTASDVTAFYIGFNNITTVGLGQYSFARLSMVGAVAGSKTTGQDAIGNVSGEINGSSASASYFTPIEIVISGQMAHRHVNTSNYGASWIARTMAQNTLTVATSAQVIGGTVAESSEVSSIQLYGTNSVTGTFESGSSFSLYGYKRLGL
jgi:hypothetical protein